jgi:hypothetical protein
LFHKPEEESGKNGFRLNNCVQTYRIPMDRIKLKVYVKFTGSENLDALFVRRTTTLYMRKAFLLGISYKDIRVL